MSIKRLGAFAATICITGCVNPAISTIRDTKATPSYSAPKALQKAEPVKKDPDAYRESDSGHTYSLTLKNADIRDVLMLLSKESGVPIISERGMSGNVQIEAQNKKLGEILYAILKPLGYTATLENGIIMVGRPKLSTRTFRVNYIKDKRSSSSNMNVSGFSGGSGGSSGSGSSSGGGGSGSVSVSTEAKTDFWGALESSLEMLVFGTSNMGKHDGGAYVRGETEKKLDVKLEKGGSDKAVASDVVDPMISSTQLTESRLKQLLVNELAGIIQVTDYPENLDKIALFLQDVEEGSKRQVLIQAHIMEVSLKDSFSLGIDWKYIFDKAANLTISQALSTASVTAFSSSAASNVFKVSAGNSHFTFLLDAMKEQGNVNMLSSPKITALNNQKAVIKLTTKQVSWVSSKTSISSGGVTNDTFTTSPQVDEVGIFLDVTPQIGQDGAITMQIHPSVSEIREISTSPDKTSNKPIIDVREIDTLVDAKAGETIVIAGLISDKLSETKRSIPMLGDIPYLGNLFSYNAQERNKAELVIMMTPYVLNAKTVEEIRIDHEKRISNMGESFHLINNLGGMVTEKGYRDFKTRSESLIQSLNPAYETVENPKQSEPVATTDKAASPQTQQDTQKKNEILALPVPTKVQSTFPRPIIPVAEKPENQSAVSGVAVKQNASAVSRIDEELKAYKAQTAPITAPQPELKAITTGSDSIKFEIPGLDKKPHVILEKQARRVVVKLPGIKNMLGANAITIDRLGFSRADILRKQGVIWVILYASGTMLPPVATASDAEGLTLVVTKPAKRIATAQRVQEKPLSTTTQVVKAVAATVPLENPPPTQTTAQTVSTVSTTTDREQTLYRSAVTAYKIGDCRESIKAFDLFLKQYPASPFAQDAAYYRKDCFERQTLTDR